MFGTMLIKNLPAPEVIDSWFVQGIKNEIEATRFITPKHKEFLQNVQKYDTSVKELIKETTIEQDNDSKKELLGLIFKFATTKFANTQMSLDTFHNVYQPLLASKQASKHFKIVSGTIPTEVYEHVWLSITTYIDQKRGWIKRHLDVDWQRETYKHTKPTLMSLTHPNQFVKETIAKDKIAHALPTPDKIMGLLPALGQSENMTPDVRENDRKITDYLEMQAVHKRKGELKIQQFNDLTNVPHQFMKNATIILPKRFH